MQRKNFRNFIYLLKVQRVCLLGQRWLNSNLTCLNTIQSAKVCKNCGKWFCFLFEALISENIVINQSIFYISNKVKNIQFSSKCILYNIWSPNSLPQSRRDRVSLLNFCVTPFTRRHQIGAPIFPGDNQLFFAISTWISLSLYHLF